MLLPDRIGVARVRLCILDGLKGEVAIDAGSVVAIVPDESPIGAYSAVLLAGGHKVVVSGSVGEVYEALSAPPSEGSTADARSAAPG
jgi:hypothetical protein